MTIRWDPSLALGIEDLDAQHQEFFRRLQGFLDACKANQGAQALGQTLQYLRRYAEAHFSDEERFMRERHYPYLETHQEQHREFAAKVSALATEFEARGARADTIAEAMELTSTWLIRHIKSTDLLIVRWLQRETGG